MIVAENVKSELCDWFGRKDAGLGWAVLTVIGHGEKPAKTYVSAVAVSTNAIKLQIIKIGNALSEELYKGLALHETISGLWRPKV